jgi:hypothetical protein
MNPYILNTILFDRLVIEIDWVEGCVPSAQAIRGLEKRLDQYLPAEMELSIEVDDEIPRERWDALTRTHEQDRRIDALSAM